LGFKAGKETVRLRYVHDGKETRFGFASCSTEVKSEALETFGNSSPELNTTKVGLGNNVSPGKGTESGKRIGAKVPGMALAVGSGLLE